MMYMKRNIFIIVMSIIVIIACIGAIFFIMKNKKSDIEENQNKDTNIKVENYSNTTSNLDEDTKNSNNMEKINMDEIIIKVNGRVLNVKLEDNTSAKAFAEKLKSGDITISAHDYGNFEKVGNLGFSLPANDKNITTEAGDLILYQGNQITLYYDTNSWNFTKLGKVQNVLQNELKEILGSGNVKLTFSLND